ncbi:TPA: hypothetical protein O8433_000877 [Staphylococcus aureus]|uniref:hypothetical protein n=1 Tax=Staphylococcus aureus TaxID=1280 RepID=UPI0002F6DC0A|nr:hypothetical protein [Staphylococcus aureus]MBZ5402055.1 hypothetical protein [Staphylococcus aureus]MBZ5421210.1 hypothetical protein [Staphylococcus aureus]MDI0239002.1 hypothetical protein [Staphylococcus aureus]HCY8688900.1 hypothetical protein [Staphylococcus aureus]HDC6176401.1 hypothetical protein [Staphylococcus aureus]
MRKKAQANRNEGNLWLLGLLCMRKAQANRNEGNLWLLGAFMHAQSAGEPK